MKRAPLKRYSGLKRTGPPRRAVPLKKSNVRRKQREFQRAYGGHERVAFVKSLPCIVSYVTGATCSGPIDNAHVTDDGSKGKGRKAGAACIAPICRQHHMDLHAHGDIAFQNVFGISLQDAAAVTERAWQKHVAGGQA